MQRRTVVLEQKENISRSTSRSRSSSPAVPVTPACVTPAAAPLRCRPVVNLSERNFVGANVSIHRQEALPVPLSASHCPQSHPHILRDEHNGFLRDAFSSKKSFIDANSLALLESAVSLFATSLSAMHRNQASLVFEICSIAFYERAVRRVIEECSDAVFQGAAQFANVKSSLHLTKSAEDTTSLTVIPLPCDTCAIFRDDRRKLLVQIARREEEIVRLRRELCGHVEPSSSSSSLVRGSQKTSLLARLTAKAAHEEVLSVSPMSSRLSSPSVERAPSPQTPPPQPAPLNAESSRVDAATQRSLSSVRSFSSSAAATSSIFPLQSALLRQATHEIRVLQNQRDALILLLEKVSPLPRQVV